MILDCRIGSLTSWIFSSCPWRPHTVHVMIFLMQSFSSWAPSVLYIQKYFIILTTSGRYLVWWKEACYLCTDLIWLMSSFISFTMLHTSRSSFPWLLRVLLISFNVSSSKCTLDSSMLASSISTSSSILFWNWGESGYSLSIHAVSPLVLIFFYVKESSLLLSHRIL